MRERKAEGTITDLAGLYEAENNAREKDKMISELEVLQRQFDEATDLAFEIVRTTHRVPVASAETQQYTGNSHQQCRDEARAVGGWWPGHVYSTELSAGPLPCLGLSHSGIAGQIASTTRREQVRQR